MLVLYDLRSWHCHPKYPLYITYLCQLTVCCTDMHYLFSNSHLTIMIDSRGFLEVCHVKVMDIRIEMWYFFFM